MVTRGMSAYASPFILIFVYSLFLFAMSMMPGMNFFVTAKNHMSSDLVMLTFDDGPHPELTPKTLDILKEKQVKAMFFLIGKNVEAHPELVKRIITEGHRVGGHTYLHEPAFGFKFGSALDKDIMRAQNLLTDLSGKEEVYFRPPFGVTNPNIAQVIKKRGLQMIGWSLRTYDTAYDFDSLKVQKIVSQTKPGDIILMHERVKSTCDALPELIDGIRKRGMDFGVLSQ